MEDHKIIDLYWARSQQAIVESDQKYGPYCRAKMCIRDRGWRGQ